MIACLNHGKIEGRMYCICHFQIIMMIIIIIIIIMIIIIIFIAGFHSMYKDMYINMDPIQSEYSKNSLQKIRKMTYEKRRKQMTHRSSACTKHHHFIYDYQCNTWTDMYRYIVHKVTEYDKQM